MKHYFESILRDHGLKATPARLKVLNLFSKDCHPMNADEIFAKIKHEADRVTIYRMLQSFEQAGIISRVDLRKGSVYYELTAHHHHHIICTRCGFIEHFDDCDMGSVMPSIARQSKKFSRITDHALELFGLCTACEK